MRPTMRRRWLGPWRQRPTGRWLRPYALGDGRPALLILRVTPRGRVVDRVALDAHGRISERLL